MYELLRIVSDTELNEDESQPATVTSRLKIQNTRQQMTLRDEAVAQRGKNLK
jgi:hypothetical protein